MKDRLIEILGAFPVWGKTLKYQWFDEAIERLADHLLANGVIVPPVKVGQTVWYIHGGYYRKYGLEARPITVTEISQKEVKGKLQWAFIANSTRYTFGSIGKTVFLTKEEAEKVLAKMKGGAE